LIHTRVSSGQKAVKFLMRSLYSIGSSLGSAAACAAMEVNPGLSGVTRPVHVTLRDRASDAGAQASRAGRYAEPEALFLPLLGGSDDFSHVIKAKPLGTASLDVFRQPRVRK
jgi:hypothetical protein